jgi:universal stress protein A
MKIVKTSKKGSPTNPSSMMKEGISPSNPALKSKERAVNPRELNLKRILVPIDFSATSLKALRYAIPFAEQFGATIHLVHVVERAPFIYDVESMAMTIPEATLVKAAKEKLDSMANEEIKELVPVTAEVYVGKPFDEVAKAAKASDVDLIIIGTHGHTGLKHVLLGSTAERVVRYASCPVLVVREQEHDFI